MSDRTHTLLRVRYGETDKMGVVYHANYVVYFEIGRTDYMRRQGVNYVEIEAAGFNLAVLDIGARYVQPARYDEQLAVETRLTSATALKVRFDYRILRVAAAGVEVCENPADPQGGAGTLVCEGHTTLVCVNAAGRPTRLTSPWKERMQELVSEA